MRTREKMIEMLENLIHTRKKYKNWRIVAEDIGIGLSTLRRFRSVTWVQEGGSYSGKYEKCSDETLEKIDMFLDSIYKKKTVEENKMELHELLGKTIYLDLGDLGPSELKVIGLNADRIYLRHWNGKEIDLDIKSFRKLYHDDEIKGYEIKEEVILPCPFCGGEAELVECNSNSIYMFEVICVSAGCLVTPSTGKCELKVEALINWNTRKRSGR